MNISGMYRSIQSEQLRSDVIHRVLIVLDEILSGILVDGGSNFHHKLNHLGVLLVLEITWYTYI